jgi:hypothetical protein
VFKRQATKIFTDLSDLAKDYEFELKLNEEGKPKRGSFEISVIKDSKTTKIWSGLDKGPPRKEKFPEASAILDDLLKALKSKK